MSGDKLRQAKRAAIMALGLARTHDTISIVTYASGVNVLVPATRLHDRALIERRIEKIFSGGSTALHAGVETGGEQLMRYLDREHVNRLILLSDGLANVGPKSPEALADLGYDLVKKGVSVTTLGLGTGYNEDLMTRLANVTDGNHAFVETATSWKGFLLLNLAISLPLSPRISKSKFISALAICPNAPCGANPPSMDNIVRARIRQVYGARKKI